MARTGVVSSHPGPHTHTNTHTQRTVFLYYVFISHVKVSHAIACMLSTLLHTHTHTHWLWVTNWYDEPPISHWSKIKSYSIFWYTWTDYYALFQVTPFMSLRAYSRSATCLIQSLSGQRQISFRPLPALLALRLTGMALFMMLLLMFVNTISVLCAFHWRTPKTLHTKYVNEKIVPWFSI